jgi:hypothetical protein
VQLNAASDARQTVELILAVRGRVVSVSGRYQQRWRIRTQGGHVLTFRPEFVVALTATKCRKGATVPARPASEGDGMRDTVLPAASSGSVASRG